MTIKINNNNNRSTALGRSVINGGGGGAGAGGADFNRCYVYTTLALGSAIAHIHANYSVRVEEF